MKLFGEQLKEARMRRQFTLRAWCRLAGIDPSNWSKQERGISPAPNVEVVRHWAKMLKLDAKAAAQLEIAASVSRREIPFYSEALDAVVLQALPLFLCGCRGERFSQAKLARLLKEIRKIHSSP